MAKNELASTLRKTRLKVPLSDKATDRLQSLAPKFLKSEICVRFRSAIFLQLIRLIFSLVAKFENKKFLPRIEDLVLDSISFDLQKYKIPKFWKFFDFIFFQIFKNPV